jgi:late competence protein required for DNA uptake (superfamily II DNA/RNA helicase)
MLLRAKMRSKAVIATAVQRSATLQALQIVLAGTSQHSSKRDRSLEKVSKATQVRFHSQDLRILLPAIVFAIALLVLKTLCLFCLLS